MALTDVLTRRVAITVNAASFAGAGGSTGFPLMLTEANLPAEMIAQAQANGGDIRFSADRGGNSEIPSDMVVWAPGTPKALFFVKVDFPASGDLTFWAFYKPSGGAMARPAAADPAGSRAVWSGYYLVSHSGVTNEVDGAAITLVGTNSQTAGPLDSAIQLDGTSAYGYVPGPGGNGSFPWTMQAWIKPDLLDATDRTVMALTNSGSTAQTYYNSFLGGSQGANALGSHARNSETTSVTFSTAPAVANVWQLTHSVFAGSANRRSFIGGANKGTGTATGNPTFTANRLAFGALARSNLSSFFPGAMAEIRACRTALSDGWVAAEQANMGSPAAFASAGAAEDATPIVAAPVSPALAFAYNNAAIYYPPAAWRDTGAEMRCQSQGNYFRVNFTGPEFWIQTNQPAWGGYPRLRLRVDDGPFVDVTIGAGSAWTRLIAGLADTAHVIDVWIVALYRNNADSSANDAWSAGSGHRLSITGVGTAAGKALSAPAKRAKFMIGYGHSTMAGNFMYGTTLSLHDDATRTAFPLLAEALDAEYAMIFYGGQGFSTASGGQVPGLHSSWNLYYAGQSRLAGGLLPGNPDYVLLNHGGNGATTDADVKTWRDYVRPAAPNAKLIVVNPIGDLATANIVAGFNAAAAVDPNMVYVPTNPRLKRGMTQRAADGTTADTATPTFAAADNAHGRDLTHARWATWIAQQVAQGIRRFTVAVS